MEIKSEIVTQLEYYWSQSNKKKLFTIKRSEKLMTNTLLYEDDVSTSVWERGKLLTRGRRQRKESYQYHTRHTSYTLY